MVNNIAPNIPSTIPSIFQQLLKRENKIAKGSFCWVLCLNQENEWFLMEMVAESETTDAINVLEPIDLFFIPKQHKAASIVVIQSRLNGSIVPSDQDKILTSTLLKFCQAVKAPPLLDHLIINEKEFFSFSAAGLLKE